jgi:hypothetical protein
MVTTEDLTRRSKPVLALEGLYNWIGRCHKDPETELAEDCAPNCRGDGSMTFAASSNRNQTHAIPRRTLHVPQLAAPKVKANDNSVG